MHKSCKECAPVCTKVTSYTDLTRAYLLSKRLETWWRKKENTHRLPRPSLCVKGCKGVTMAVSKRENIVLEQQFLVESQLWGFIFLYFYLIFYFYIFASSDCEMVCLEGYRTDWLSKPQRERIPIYWGAFHMFGIMESRDGRGSGRWPHSPPHPWAGSLLGNILGRCLFYPFWKIPGGGDSTTACLGNCSQCSAASEQHKIGTRPDGFFLNC